MGKEFSLKDPATKTLYAFESFAKLLEFIKRRGEMAGWIITIHHM